LVDPDMLEVVRLEVEDFLRGSFLENAPVVAVSSLTGQGLDELKDQLRQLAAVVPTRDAHAAFRLPIDRVFTMKGFGTVVTGTLISGQVKKEEELELFPSRKKVRVRGIQVHNQPADEALAGQRTALNLAGVATEDLSRGMMLAPVGWFRATVHADAQITLLPGARPLRDRARVHFHGYSAETIAQVRLLGLVDTADGAEAPASAADRGRAGSSSTAATKGPTSSAGMAAQTARPEGPGKASLPTRPTELRPGQTAWVRLRLAEPLLLLPGDRFILRQFSPVVTVGGGLVLDAAPLPGKVRSQTASFLQRLGTGSPGEILEARIARRGGRGLSLADAVAETGWTRAEVESTLTSSARLKGWLRFGNVLIATAAFAAAETSACQTVAEFHRTTPLVAGIGKEALREKLQLGPEVFNGLLEALVRAGKLQVEGEVVRQAGRTVVMKQEETESQRQIEQAFASAGLKVPALKEVLAGVKVDRARAQQIVTLLLRSRVLVKISEDLVFHHTALEQLRRMIADCKPTSPKIDVARFKDLTGISRKYAIPLLEYLDREHVTRRVGDERLIL
jgi:selenocysteine-specific elongation factor